MISSPKMDKKVELKKGYPLFTCCVVGVAIYSTMILDGFYYHGTIITIEKNCGFELQSYCHSDEIRCWKFTRLVCIIQPVCYTPCHNWAYGIQLEHAEVLEIKARPTELVTENILFFADWVSANNFLFTDWVSANNFLFVDRVSANNFLFTDRVSANIFLFADRVSANNLFL